MSRLTRDASPNSQARTRTRKSNFHLNLKHNWQPYPVDAQPDAKSDESDDQLKHGYYCEQSDFKGSLVMCYDCRKITELAVRKKNVKTHSCGKDLSTSTLMRKTIASQFTERADSYHTPDVVGSIKNLNVLTFPPP